MAYIVPMHVKPKFTYLLTRILSTQNFSLNTVQLVLPQHTTCLMSTLPAALSRCAQDWGNNSGLSGWVSSPSIRAGVKYVLSNTNTNTLFSGVSNTNTNTSAKIWSNTNTNTAHQIQIQIQIHNEAETKLLPFYRWHIQIHCIARRLFYWFKFHWKLFPKVQSKISLHWFR